jgi:hypothetical protein
LPAAQPTFIQDEPVILQLTTAETRRIVRALEQASFSLGGSPSGSRSAASYMRLTGTIRRQTEHAPAVHPNG